MSHPTPDEVVTLVIRHRVKAGREADYAAWLRSTVSTAARSAGHLGVDVHEGKHEGLAQYTCVLRYRTVDDMRQWLDSAERQALIAEAQPMLADGDQTEVSPAREFWFAPTTEQAPPPRWKQAVVTLCVILPLTLGVPQVWGPAFRAVNWLSGYFMSTFVVTLTIVLLVVYLLMPFATRLAAPWLQRK